MTLSVDTNSKYDNSHELLLFLSRHNHTASHILTKKLFRYYYLTNKTTKGTRRFWSLMQGKYWWRQQIFGKDDQETKNSSSSPKILCEDDKKWKNLSSSPQNNWTDWTDYTDNTNADRQSLPSLSSWERILSSQLIAWWHLIVLTRKQLY